MNVFILSLILFFSLGFSKEAIGVSPSAIDFTKDKKFNMSNVKTLGTKDFTHSSTSFLKVNPQIRQNYEPMNTQNIESEERTCGMNDAWERSGNEHRTCNYYGITDNPDVRDAFIPSPSDEIIYLKLAIHIFADDNGNNPTSNIENIEAQIFTLNEAFYSHKIQFVAWYQIHNNSNFLVQTSEEWFSGVMKEQYNQDPTVYHNIYVCDSDPTWGILGISTFPWMSNAISIYGGTIIDKDWFGGPRTFNNIDNVPQKTIVHELGHALGLWHTHRGSLEVEECSNC